MNGQPGLHSSAVVVVVGDVMVDTLVMIDRPLAIGVDHPMRFLRRVGGQAANTSAWLAWSGVTAHLVAVCGEDDDGTWVDERLRSIGVLTHMPRDHEPTGSCIVIVDPTAERTMFSSPGANRTIADVGRAEVNGVWEALEPTTIAHLHLSGYLLDRDPELVADLASQAPEHATVSLDTAAFPPQGGHRRSLDEALADLDVLIGTEDELRAFLDPDPSDKIDLESVVHRWRDRFAGTIVVKQGAAGVSALDRYGLHQVPALTTNVVDTTGAGDAFTAGFLAAWVANPEALPEALGCGIRAASRAVGRIGADPPAQAGR